MFTTAPRAATSQIMVQAYGGFGEFAQFDPATGELQPAALAMRTPGGVYGEIGGIPVVLYRGAGGLALRVGERLFDLEADSVSIVWEMLAGNQTRFAVCIGGEPTCELRYLSLPPDLDMALLIRDVCDDPERRAHIFAR